MTSIVTVPSWVSIAAHAGRIREQVGECARRWGAAYHVATRGGAMPNHWVAVVCITSKPIRSGIAASDPDSSDRDHGEAAADDLWDAVAVGWSFVKWLAESRLPHDPGAERIVAELQAAGRWLAEYPVMVSAHDAAIARLFCSDGGE
jgi:hypothetical protein